MIDNLENGQKELKRETSQINPLETIGNPYTSRDQFTLL